MVGAGGSATSATRQSMGQSVGAPVAVQRQAAADVQHTHCPLPAARATRIALSSKHTAARAAGAETGNAERASDEFSATAVACSVSNLGDLGESGSAGHKHGVSYRIGSVHKYE